VSIWGVPPIFSVPAKAGSVIVGADGVVVVDVELSAVWVLHPAAAIAVSNTSGKRCFM
jgi:hypothetical protein